MRLRSLLVSTLAALLLLPAGLRAADKPTVVVRLASVDSLAARGKYLAKLIDRVDEFDQVEGFLKAFTGPKGIEGLDTTKPLGLYGKPGPNGLDSEIVVMVPVADSDKILDFLKKQNITWDKLQNGAYKIDVTGSPLPGYLRFANGYGYFTVQDDAYIDPKKLADPKTLFPAGQIGLATVLFDLEQIPPGMKALALEAIQNEFTKQKENLPENMPEAEKQGQLVGMELAANLMKSLINEGGPLTLQLDLNEAKQQVSVTASFAAQANSALAKSLADLGKAPSVAAGAIPTGGIFSGVLNTSLPAKARELLVGQTEKNLQKDLEKITDPRAKAAVKALADGLLPTLKAGDVDLGLALVPAEGGKYIMVTTARVAQGSGLEKAFKTAVGQMEENEKRAVGLTLDLDKVDGVNIHGAKAPKLDPDGKRLFGEGTMHFAFRDNAVIFAFGNGSLGAVRTALANKPRPAGIASGSINLARVVGLLPPDQAKKAEPLFKKVFGANPAGGDTIRATLDGGKELKLELTVPAAIIQLIAEGVKLQQRQL